MLILLLSAGAKLDAQTYTMGTSPATNGATISTCSGIFYDSGGSGGNYGLNQNTTVTFCSNNGQPISLSFDNFLIGFNDFFYLYDGPSTASAQFSGSPYTNVGFSGGPKVKTSSGTCITIRFTSDASSSISDQGWEANVFCASSSTITGCSGSFFDPGGSGGNTPDLNSTITTICSDNGGNPSVSFSSFSLENAFDFLYVYNGADRSAPQIAGSPFTGTSGPGTVNGTGTCLTFHFISDGSTGASGWASTISCIGGCTPASLTAIPTCMGATYDVSGTVSYTSPPSTGTLTVSDGAASQVFNPPFGTSVNYTLSGLSPGSGSHTVTATFSDASPCNGSTMYSAPASCGPVADYVLDVGSNGTTINTCSGLFADSGNLGGNYGNNENYTVTFCSNSNNQISFTFDHFNTQAGVDFLSIYDGSSTGAPIIGTYSGFGEANSPGVVTSTNDCLTFQFSSNGSSNALGWEASISCTGTPDVVASSGSWTGYPTASACASSTEIRGVVYEDIDDDGTQDARDNGIFGITVTLFDDNGQVGSPTTTNATGAYSFTGLTASTVYRVEFTIPASLFEGPHGSSSGTAVQFIQSGRCDANLGLVDPAHYCDDTNPYFVIPCYVNGDPQHSSNTGSTGVARFRYNDSGNSPSSTYVNYVTINAIGSTWGVSYDAAAERLYMSSVLKRHAGLGPSGIGAIYYHDDSAPNSSAPVFYNFGSAAGTVASNATRFPGIGNAFGQEGPCGACDNIDPTTFAQVGKVGFGDIDINPENTKMYVTNLYDRKIYTIDLNNPTPGSATPLPGIPWLNNSPCNNGVARPWGLEFRRGKLYVGVVCDASLSSCSPTSPCSDLTGNIYSFDGTNWTLELSFPLTYYRDAYVNGSDYFVKWIDDWNTMSPYVANKTDANFAQPVIMDIEFDDDNAMIIGIGDRTGLQLGYQAPPPPGPISSTAERNMAFGDILRAAYNNAAGTFTLENNGVAGSLTTTNPTGNSGPGGKSFYWGDYWTGIGANKWQGGIGSLMLLPGSGEVAFPLADAIDYYSNGISWMRNTNGSTVKRLEVYQGSSTGNAPNFAKGTGVGDMVLFCESRPIEIGNIVWWDDDFDGLQDPSEPGINNVTVELYKWNGSSYVKVAETTTDAYGRYVFSQSGSSNGLNAENWSFTADNAVLPNTQYQIRISNWSADTGISTYSVGLGYAGTLISPANTQGASGDERDNDATDNSGDAVITLNTGEYGENKHSYDFAFSGAGGCDAPVVVPGSNTPCVGETLNLIASASGGISPYTFSWSGPNGFSSSAQNPTLSITNAGTQAGMYSLTVTDNVGCSEEVSINVAINELLLSLLSTDATCGNSNGQIDLTITGTAPYIIDWSNDGIGDNDDTEDLTGLAAGNYNVTVTDADACVESASASIGSSGSVSLSATQINETCTDANGSIDLTIVGAFTTISWSNSSGMEDLSGLSAGTYSVTVNNVSNCPATLSVEITNTPGPSLASSQVNDFCGAGNASIDLSVTGGTGPYTFDWDNDGTGDNDDTEDLTSLMMGTYNVTITDANMCTDMASVMITNTPGPTLSPIPTDETCGNANGSIDLTVSGGTEPFTFLWSNGLNTEDISGLGTGNFSVIVTDANGCIATTMATVNNIDGPTLAVTPTSASDCTSQDGSIDLTITGGAAPFMIDWNNDGTGDNDDIEDLNGLPSGSYMVIVTDNNGCQATIGATILNSTDPVLSISVIDPATCAETGSIDLTVTGGNGPFTFDWSNDGLGDNDDTEDISGLAGGTYTIVVTGNDGCSVQENASIRVIRDPVLDAILVNPDCGMNNGSITLTISDLDGSGPYTFDWDNDGTGDNDDLQNLSALAAGNYSVTVTNSISCTATATFSLNPSASPTIITFQNNPTCNGSNGDIDLQVTGGTSPYTYDWDNDGTGDNDDLEDLNGLSEGTYNVTVTDNLGCVAATSVELVSSEPAVLNAATTPESCTTNDGAINLTIIGIAPFSIDWDNDGTGDNDDMEDLSGLAAGMYSVTVTDNNGCTTTNTFNVSDACVIMCNLNTPSIVATCNDNGTSDPGDDTFSYTIEVSGTGTGISYSISGDDTQGGLAYNTVNGPYGPFPISGGDLTITITDDNDASCQLVDEIVSAPAACSVPDCALSITATTISSCSAGNFSTTLSLDWTDAPTTGDFEYSLDGGSFQTLVRTNLAANATGELITISGMTCQVTEMIEIRFENNPTCFAQVQFIFPPTDPIGYIYCVETGEVITGGTISVVPPVGGMVNIIEDGSTGRYSWAAVGSPIVAGIYSMSYTPPVGYTNTGTAGDRAGDTDDVLDPTGGSEDNPGSADPLYLGSAVNGSGTQVLNFSTIANPFFLQFDLELGDPFIDRNNLPVEGCTPPCPNGNCFGVQVQVNGN
ncbi:MAG TPA: SdrD B-like domain-containing protein [Saprospiraceae bacterium]|nr:SdrD B-like domain-containing protein [Saprospiraceae bacterium]HMQ82958.1 SdrD B-like domain-containing protein [Saprospiraceae bacterium]